VEAMRSYAVFGIVALAIAALIAVVSPILALLFFLTSLGAAVYLNRVGGRKAMWFGAPVVLVVLLAVAYFLLLAAGSAR
jgi:hypothetical protein